MTTKRRRPPRNADGTFKRRTAPRRNPREKRPSHDLFGERTHQTGLFGGKVYTERPMPKKTAAEKKREAKRNAGQSSFPTGLTRGLFG